MKNLYLICLFCCIVNLLSYNEALAIPFTYEKKPYNIITTFDKVSHDKQTGYFIVLPNSEQNIIHVIFDKRGKVLKLGNKSIKYKNGRISQIGNDYITYLNGQLYTIGGKFIEKQHSCVTKIGDMSIEKYFTGKELTQYEAININKCGKNIKFSLNSDGSGIGCSMSGIIMYFEGVPVVDGFNKTIKYNNGFFTCGSAKITKIGFDRVYYDENGRIKEIGGHVVRYKGEKIDWIDNDKVEYDGFSEKIIRIGNDKIIYEFDNMVQFGDKKVKSYGKRIYKIGNDYVDYDTIP